MKYTNKMAIIGIAVLFVVYVLYTARSGFAPQTRGTILNYDGKGKSFINGTMDATNFANVARLIKEYKDENTKIVNPVLEGFMFKAWEENSFFVHYIYLEGKIWQFGDYAAVNYELGYPFTNTKEIFEMHKNSRVLLINPKYFNRWPYAKAAIEGPLPPFRNPVTRDKWRNNLRQLEIIR